MNAIQILIKGPSWKPGLINQPWTGLLKPMVQKNIFDSISRNVAMKRYFYQQVKKRAKYEVPIPLWQKFYVAVHITLLIFNFYQIPDRDLQVGK